MSVQTDSLPLVGREESLARLAALTEAVRAGAGGAIRIEGTPGVGKSALLEAAAPSDLTVLRAVGVEAEAGIPLAGLEDLMHGLGAGSLPTEDGEGQDPVALLREVSTRLAEAAPLLCLVDDVQWLDPSSRAAIAYLARRAERLGIGVIAVWSLRGEAPDEWPGVETLALEELRREDALALARRGGLADPVAEALVAAVGGNALALVEAPAELSAAQRGGRAILPDPLPAGERLQRAFTARVAELPEATRDALLLAAAGAPATMVVSVGAEPPHAATGDAGSPSPTGRGACRTRPRSPRRWDPPRTRGSSTSAPAASPSPTRSSAPPSTTARAPSARREAHRRIADAVPEPERSWQLAQAAPAPDEELAARLEELGEEARRRGAPGTAATVLERSVALSPDPADATRPRPRRPPSPPARPGGRRSPAACSTRSSPPSPTRSPAPTCRCCAGWRSIRAAVRARRSRCSRPRPPRSRTPTRCARRRSSPRPASR